MLHLSLCGMCTTIIFFNIVIFDMLLKKKIQITNAIFFLFCFQIPEVQAEENWVHIDIRGNRFCTEICIPRIALDIRVEKLQTL